MFHAGFFLFLAHAAFAQQPLLDKTISLPRQSTTLYEALTLISQKADCFFIYNSEDVSSDRKVKLHGGTQTLGKVLDDLLSGTGLEYKVLGKHILVSKTGKAVPAVAKAQPVVEKDSSGTIEIRGHVYDHQNKAPIPYATVGIIEENTGSVTNNDGFFSIRLPASRSGAALVVSHLGYMSQRVPVQLVRDQQVDFYLDRRVISIQEVIIRYIDPVSILQNALEQRKMNDATEPVYLTTFYREGVEKNDRYISYSEAVFKVYKTPYNFSDRSDQVKLLKSRKVQNMDPGDTVFLKLKAGVLSALQLDIVKNLPGFLDLSPPVQYTWSYSNLVSFDDRDAYAITFRQAAGVDDALYTGTLYIDKVSFAILGAEFEINPAYLDKAVQDLVLRKSPKLILKLGKISYSVSYTQFNGRYYLGHVRCDIDLTTRLRHRLSADRFRTFLELATCNIDTAHVQKFPKEEVLRTNVVFSDQPYSPDDAFWGSYNSITPEEKLSDALSKIIGRIEKIE